MPRLNDYGLKDRDATTLRIDDIADEEVTIKSVDILTGNYGDFAVMTIIRASGEIVPVMSGGMFVMDALTDALVQDAFPCQVKFFKRGRSWLFE